MAMLYSTTLGYMVYGSAFFCFVTLRDAETLVHSRRPRKFEMASSQKVFSNRLRQPEISIYYPQRQ